MNPGPASHRGRAGGGGRGAGSPPPAHATPLRQEEPSETRDAPPQTVTYKSGAHKQAAAVSRCCGKKPALDNNNVLKWHLPLFYGAIGKTVKSHKPS